MKNPQARIKTKLLLKKMIKMKKKKIKKKKIMKKFIQIIKHIIEIKLMIMKKKFQQNQLNYIKKQGEG